MRRERRGRTREIETMEMEMGRKGGVASSWKGWRQQRTLVLVIIASILERADMSVIPAVYREMGLAMHLNPTSMGIFRLVGMLTQAFSSPFTGYLALRYKRTKVIAGGALVSTIAAFVSGISTTFPQIAFSIALNSLGVAVTWPAIQSLIADATDESNRGTTFGWLQLTSHGGAFFGGVTAVLLAGTSVFGVSGWRVAFFLMSSLSLLISVSLHLFADDPVQNSCSFLGAGARCGEGLANPTVENDSCGCESIKLTTENGGGEDFAACRAKKPFHVKTATEQWKDMLEDVRLVVGVKTFQVIVLQGMVVSMAFAALSFSTMWLELVGFSHPQTATIFGLFLLAGSLGGLFAGFMGDRIAGVLPNAGRIIISQFGNGIAIPFITILLLLLPVNPSTSFYHGLLFFLMGCCLSWTTPATIFPIMAEVVPTKSRTNIYALEKGFVSVVGAFYPPLVGLMSEKIFGYIPVPKGADGTLLVSIDRKNAVALGHAMYACAGLPFFLSCLIFIPLYWYYPRERDLVRDQLEGKKLEDIVAGEKPEFCIVPEGEEEEPTDDENEDSRMLLGQPLKSV